MTDSEQAIARPGQLLSEHLDGVVRNVERLVPVDATTPQNESFEDLIRTVAHLHDVGKYTSAFQTYIQEEPDRPPTHQEYHAAPGAILTFHALAARGFCCSTATAGFYAVLKHHQGLPDIEEEHFHWQRPSGRYPAIRTKLQDIDANARAEADHRLRKATDGALTWADVHIDTPERYATSFDPVPFGNTFDEFYPLLQRAWSTLACADKLDAAGVPLTSMIERADPARIEFDNDATGIVHQLNTHRARAQKDVSDRLSALGPDSSNVFTLTLPTGFGKTFAGIRAAIERAERLDGRVIYALPYTTILDQVDDDIRTHLGVSPTSPAYTLHHHLADTRTTVTPSDDTVSDGSESLYGESWQAGLVLTTFVQLFESVAGPENTQSMKLPALQDAIIIIDEPQVLPRE